MTKFRAAAHLGIGVRGWTESSNEGPTASGGRRDDNFEGVGTPWHGGSGWTEPPLRNQADFALLRSLQRIQQVAPSRRPLLR
jgi:hypothetical protein